MFGIRFVSLLSRELLPILKTEPVTLINVVQMSKLYLSGELSVGQWRRQGV